MRPLALHSHPMKAADMDHLTRCTILPFVFFGAGSVSRYLRHALGMPRLRHWLTEEMSRPHNSETIFVPPSVSINLFGSVMA